MKRYIFFFAALLAIASCEPKLYQTSTFDAEMIVNGPVIDNGDGVAVNVKIKTDNSFVVKRIDCTDNTFTFDDSIFEKTFVPEGDGKDKCVTITSNVCKPEKTGSVTLTMYLCRPGRSNETRVSATFDVYNNFYWNFTKSPVYLIDGNDAVFTIESNQKLLHLSAFSCPYENNGVLKKGSTYRLELNANGMYTTTFTFPKVKVNAYSVEELSLTFINPENNSIKLTQSVKVPQNTKFEAAVNVLTKHVAGIPDEKNKNNYGNFEISVTSNRSKLYTDECSFKDTGASGIEWGLWSKQEGTGYKIFNKGNITSLSGDKAPYSGQFTGTIGGSIKNNMTMAFRIVLKDPDDPRGTSSADCGSYVYSSNFDVSRHFNADTLMLTQDGGKALPEYLDIYDILHASTYAADIVYSFPDGSSPTGVIITTNPQKLSGQGAMDIWVNNTNKGSSCTIENSSVSGKFKIMAVKPGPVTIRVASRLDNKVYTDFDVYVRYRAILSVDIDACDYTRVPIAWSPSKSADASWGRYPIGFEYTIEAVDQIVENVIHPVINDYQFTPLSIPEWDEDGDVFVDSEFYVKSRKGEMTWNASRVFANCDCSIHSGDKIRYVLDVITAPRYTSGKYADYLGDAGYYGKEHKSVKIESPYKYRNRLEKGVSYKSRIADYLVEDFSKDHQNFTDTESPLYGMRWTHVQKGIADNQGYVHYETDSKAFDDDNNAFSYKYFTVTGIDLGVNRKYVRITHVLHRYKCIFERTWYGTTYNKTWMWHVYDDVMGEDHTGFWREFPSWITGVPMSGKTTIETFDTAPAFVVVKENSPGVYK